MSEKLVRLTRGADIIVWQEVSEQVTRAIEALVLGQAIEPRVGQCQSDHGCIVVMNPDGTGNELWSLTTTAAFDDFCELMKGGREPVMRSVLGGTPAVV